MMTRVCLVGSLDVEWVNMHEVVNRENVCME